MKQFNAWLGTLPHKHKIVIAGNHELSFDETFMAKADIDVTKDIGHRTSHTGDSIGRSPRYTKRFLSYLQCGYPHIYMYIINKVTKC